MGLEGSAVCLHVVLGLAGRSSRCCTCGTPGVKVLSWMAGERVYQELRYCRRRQKRENSRWLKEKDVVSQDVLRIVGKHSWVPRGEGAIA